MIYDYKEWFDKAVVFAMRSLLSQTKAGILSICALLVTVDYFVKKDKCKLLSPIEMSLFSHF